MIYPFWAARTIEFIICSVSSWRCRQAAGGAWNGMSEAHAAPANLEGKSGNHLAPEKLTLMNAD
jgi:hypothetical protein